MSPVFDVAHEDARSEALDAARDAVRRGALVVLPTDTVYGVGADAFSATAVTALLEAKGRGREKPPAVLVPSTATVEGLAMGVPSYARRLMERFWPGGLTLIFRAQPSLVWDLGDTNGTVGLRMPDDEFALALLTETGPLAVSSANRTGEPPVSTVTEAGFAFGPAVEVYLDGGTRAGGVPSTIIDCTKADPVLLRRGDVTPEQLREVLGPIDLLDSTGAPISEHPEDVAPDDEAATVAVPVQGLPSPESDEADEVGATAGGQEPSEGATGSGLPDEGPALRGPGAEAPTESGARSEERTQALAAEVDEVPRRVRARRQRSAALLPDAAHGSGETAAPWEAAPAPDRGDHPTVAMPTLVPDTSGMPDTPDVLSAPVSTGAGSAGPDERGEHPTEAIPLRGVGAEPPFEREPIQSVELPGRTRGAKD